MSAPRPNVNPQLPAWTPALVLAEEQAERHRLLAAERDEWVRRIGTCGWRLETGRRRAAGTIRGKQFITVVLCCSEGHEAAAVHVYTWHPTFEGAWGEAWQEADVERTRWVTAPSGQRTLVVECTCGRPVQRNEAELREQCREVWSPGARHVVKWQP